MDYGQHVRQRVGQQASTPQSEKIPGSGQVPNTGGGFGWEIDKWARLHRFLILGSEGGTYYASERDLTKENYTTVLACIAEDGARVAQLTTDISVQGRAPKNDPAIFVLALCAALGNPDTKRLAFLLMPEVCRIGTHLFQFTQYFLAFKGWNRSLRSAVSKWYNLKAPGALAYQVSKYQQRNGWSHRDLLRLCHAVPGSTEHQLIFKWIVKGELEASVPFISGMVKAREVGADVPSLIREHKLTREMVPTEALNTPAVWEALLDEMPLTAILRNLGKMTSIGLITPFSNACGVIQNELRDVDRLHKSRIHPLNVAVTMNTYSEGHGLKGKLSWTPVSSIVDVLEFAMEKSFDNVVPTNKRTLLALDVSGSMKYGNIAGLPIMPREASAILALCVAKSEPMYQMFGFCDRFIQLDITKSDSYQSTLKKVSDLPFGATDCSLPMVAAAFKDWQVDSFLVYTDNETNTGSAHPSQALAHYRAKSGIPSKLVVLAMTANGVSIADPNDPGMLDIVGLDTATPQVVADFCR